MNTSMKDLQTLLLDRVAKLNAAMDAVTTRKEAELIVHEMQELNHRVTLTGQLLFREQSKELAARVAKVNSAKGDFDKAAKNVKNAQVALRTFWKFLLLVDEAIDLAKMLGAGLAKVP